MGGFSMGMGGAGFNPSTMDAYAALLGRMPGIVDESLGMRRTTMDSKMQDAELARKERKEALAMEKQRIADQKKREQEMKRAAQGEQNRAQMDRRARVNATAARTQNLGGIPGGYRGTMDSAVGADAYLSSR